MSKSPVSDNGLPPDPEAHDGNRSVVNRLTLFLATGAGLGRVHKAPGTIGALWGLPLAWGIACLVPSPLAQAVVIAGLCAIGVPICASAARQLGKKDPQCVVWDEIATIPLTFFLVPAVLWRNPAVWLVGFGLHRLFDISKFYPANRLERLPDGWGIMADDCAAGIYSCLVLHLLLWCSLLPNWSF